MGENLEKVMEHCPSKSDNEDLSAEKRQRTETGEEVKEVVQMDQKNNDLNAREEDEKVQIDPVSSQKKMKHACSACWYIRRKCNADCVIAPYFPLEKYNEYLAVKQCFGMEETEKIIEDAPQEERQKTAETLFKQAESRLKDLEHLCWGNCHCKKLRSIAKKVQTECQRLQRQLDKAQHERDQLKLLTSNCSVCKNNVNNLEPYSRRNSFKLGCDSQRIASMEDLKNRIAALYGPGAATPPGSEEDPPFYLIPTDFEDTDDKADADLDRVYCL